MFKINDYVYVEGNTLYHRCFSSGLYNIDHFGLPPTLRGWEYAKAPGAEAVRISSHIFDRGEILKGKRRALMTWMA